MEKNVDDSNVSEEKLQVFSLLMDGPFIFSMDKRLIYQNNNDVIFKVMMRTGFMRYYKRMIMLLLTVFR